MIELPEAVTIARQMTEALKGKLIRSGIRGNSPHKFAFYNHEPEEYEAILKGKVMGETMARGSSILAAVEPGYFLCFGDGGERITYHQSEKTVPAKHQFLLHFDDGTYLSVSVQGWGAAMLMEPAQLDAHPFIGRTAPSPLSDAFTYDHFQALFEELKPTDPASAKYFVVSKPGIPGVANGYLQDILFLARLHPKRRVVGLAEAEKVALYESTRRVIRKAVDLGGRDTERDLYDRPGGYVKILDSRTVGQPCPECGTAIEKISWLGGACYLCPKCQPL